MSRYRFDPEQLTPEACKRRAVDLMTDAARLVSERGNLDGHSRPQHDSIVAKAQVWATLATVPEPLDEIHGQLIEAERDAQFIILGDRVPDLPNLICPHGFAARLSANQAPAGERPRLVYTWAADCPSGCP